MSATLERPPAPQPTDRARAEVAGPPAAPSAGGEGGMLLAAAALLAAACLPLTRVYVGWEFLQPVIGATLVALGLSWGCRRLGAGPVLTLLGTALGWAAFVSVAFLDQTLAWGVVPTADTLAAANDAWTRGLEMVRTRPAPAFPEAELLFLTITGAWTVAHVVQELVFRLRAPIKAVLMAMVLWGVPLAIGPRDLEAWPAAVPLLAGAALLLLAFAGDDTGRWGAWVDPRVRRVLPTVRPTGTGAVLAPVGWVVAAVAITAGVALAGLLPGFGEQPVYDIRRGSGTAVTANPIVSLRANLVSPSDGPVVQVTTPRPVYLRTTSLDVYGADEEWTNDGIRGSAITGELPFEVPIAQGEIIEVEVEVADLAGAVLVPAPYQPVAVAGPASAGFQYDPGLSTVLLGEQRRLEPGDTYQVRSVLPEPDAEALNEALPEPPGGPFTALPDNVPAAVAELAADIVEQADAQTPFQQALAVQNELRSWTYSLDPPQGHSGRAMESFIENRIGYCEQYAGTMAVMLRTLGIPARVAVGYTPGRLVDESAGVYEVTNANAHAWVEVLFDDLGWVAFEPTPRDDGNVLVPTATNLAPDETVAEDPPDLDVAEADPDDSEFLPTPEDLGDDGAGQDAASPVTGDPTDADGGWWALALVLAALLAAAAATVLARRRGRAPASLPAAARVLAAQERVERLGRGLGTRPGSWETEREYLQRLAPRQPEATTLADRAAQARYAVALPDEAAPEAEAAAATLTGRLLDGLGAPRRLLVRVRGALATAWAGGTHRLRTWRRSRGGKAAVDADR